MIILILLFLFSSCNQTQQVNKTTESLKISPITMPEQPTGFIAGLDKRTPYDIQEGIIPVCAIVQIPKTSTKNVKFGFIHNADTLTIYPLPETASVPGRYKLVTYTKRFSYSQRSHFVLFSYDKTYESKINESVKTGFSLAGVLIPHIKGYEVLSIDYIGVTNTVAY